MGGEAHPCPLCVQPFSGVPHEGLINLFVSVFTASQAPHGSRSSEPAGEGWGSKVPPAVSKEQVGDQQWNQTSTDPWGSMPCSLGC